MRTAAACRRSAREPQLWRRHDRRGSRARPCRAGEGHADRPQHRARRARRRPAAHGPDAAIDRRASAPESERQSTPRGCETSTPCSCRMRTTTISTCGRSCAWPLAARGPAPAASEGSPAARLHGRHRARAGRRDHRRRRDGVGDVRGARRGGAAGCGRRAARARFRPSGSLRVYFAGTRIVRGDEHARGRSRRRAPSRRGLGTQAARGPSRSRARRAGRSSSSVPASPCRSTGARTVPSVSAVSRRRARKPADEFARHAAEIAPDVEVRIVPPGGTIELEVVQVRPPAPGLSGGGGRMSAAVDAVTPFGDRSRPRRSRSRSGRGSRASRYFVLVLAAGRSASRSSCPATGSPAATASTGSARAAFSSCGRRSDRGGAPAETVVFTGHSPAGGPSEAEQMRDVYKARTSSSSSSRRHA